MSDFLVWATASPAAMAAAPAAAFTKSRRSIAASSLSPSSYWRHPWRLFTSISGTASGNVEGRARRERTFIAGKPADQGGILRGFAQTAHGNLGPHIVDLAFRQLCQNCALECRGRDAVDQNALGSQLLAQALGEPDHGRLGCGIGRRIGIAFLAGHRGDVHDAPVSVLGHEGNDLPAAIEQAI